MENIAVITYVILIKKGKLTIEEMPENLKEEVTKELEKVGDQTSEI